MARRGVARYGKVDVIAGFDGGLGVNTNVKVVPSVFSGAGEVGDFGWMIKQHSWDDALFIFNDNEEEFLAYQNNKRVSSRFGGDGRS
jgi:hypothetical protein